MSEENLTKEQLLKRFAEAQAVSEEEAANMVGGETAEDVLENIKKFTEQKIKEAMPPMNRAQRRAWMKKHKHDKKRIKPAAETISETAEKLNYINLIQKLRELNEKKEKEIESYENADENN